MSPSTPCIVATQPYTPPVKPVVQNAIEKPSQSLKDFSLVDLDDNTKSLSMYLGKPTLILNCATL